MHRNQYIADLAPLLSGMGIEHVIICPGSRNAPLIGLFTWNSAFTCHSIVDERSAAYIALGMARQTGRPAAVVTTSGTAVMNLAPAAAEAFFQQIPLVFLTADRPRERISQFDNQVIRQNGALAAHIRGSYEFPVHVPDGTTLEKTLSEVERVLRAGMEYPGGPVHLNVPLLEPLYEPLSPPALSRRQGIPAGSSEEPGPLPQSNGDPRAAELFADFAGEGRKILVMAGMGHPDPVLAEKLEDLTSCAQVAVVAEPISNLFSDLFIGNPELVLAGAGGEERSSLLPDLVISFGGQVVSKRLRLFLEQEGQRDRIRFHEITGVPFRTLKTLSRICRKKEISGHRKVFDPVLPVGNPYLEAWKKIERRETESGTRFLESAPHSNLTAVYAIMSALPPDTVLHLGNSAAVRYAQLMPVATGVPCYSNRGTSGIDGCVSAAVGAAMVSGRMHVLVVGDLSFVYDSNALWNKDFPENLRIIVLNDGGGGIFRLLDGPSGMPFFEEYSVTHHPVSLELLTGCFGRGFLRAAGKEELEEKLEILLGPGSGISVLEVDTTGSENTRIFKDFFKRRS